MPENHAEAVANKADDILRSLNGDAGEWNSYLQRHYELIFARTAKPDNTLQCYRLLLPSNWNPEKIYPIIVFLHGSTDNPYSIYFIDSIGTKTSMEETKPEDVIDEGQYFTLLPWGRANSAYIEWGQDDIFQALADAFGKFKIDKDRTYLSGHSMGGFGTWSTSMHNPDPWAAICIAAGGVTRKMPMDVGITRNIACLPIRIWHGEKDNTVKISYAYDMQTNLRKYGNEPLMVISPEDGHKYPDNAKVESANWLLKHSRKRPDKFSYIAFSNRWSGSWGINMKRDLKITATPSFDAVIEGNTVNIKSEGTTGLTVDCGPDGLGLNGNVTIFWNGNKAYEGPAQKVKLGDGA
jgi:predicted peptidase